MRPPSPTLRRTPVRVVALVLVLLASACSDDGGERDESLGSSDQATASEGEDTENAETDDPASTAPGSSTTGETTESSGSTTTGSATTATSPSGPPSVRVGPVTIERTQACPDRTVAPTFSLTMTSDAGTESVPPPEATQVVVGEASPTEVAPAASFTVEGEWSLNVQMLEHLTGTMRGTTHTESSRLNEQITIEGQPVDVSWQVTQNAGVVEFSGASFVVSPSCVQIQPGTSVIFTDGSDSQTAGSTDPAFPEPRDLPLGRPVTVFDGATFQASTVTGWRVEVNVFEHWNGRRYDSADHTDSATVTAPVPSSNPGDQGWEIRYDVIVG